MMGECLNRGFRARVLGPVAWRVAMLLAAAVVALPPAVAPRTAAAQDDDEAAQSESATQTYARLRAEIDHFTRHNAYIEGLIDSQAANITSLEAQLAGLDATAASLEPLMTRMYSELEDFVDADLPFLRSERAVGLDRLADLMAQEGNVSEKFRRLLEAIQIELEYGRTFATYSGVLADGRAVDFVHVGRIAFLYRTVDGLESGYWDAAQGAWVVAEGNDREIRDALSMAKEQVAPDLLVLPVPAPTEARQ